MPVSTGRSPLGPAPPRQAPQLTTHLLPKLHPGPAAPRPPRPHPPTSRSSRRPHRGTAASGTSRLSHAAPLLTQTQPSVTYEARGSCAPARCSSGRDAASGQREAAASRAELQ